MKSMDEDLKDLVGAWLGEPLSENRYAQLEARLRLDAHFREHAAQQIALLGQIRAVQTAEPRWLTLEQLLGSDTFEPADFEMETMERIRRGGFSFSGTWRALAASLVVLVGGFWLWWAFGGDPRARLALEKPQPNSGRELAVVTFTRDLTGSGSVYRAQDGIPAGSLKIDSGQLQMRFFSGATVTIEGPAELELRTEMEAIVHQGLVLANVPSVADGFTIRTRAWRVVDRGTVFGVDARHPERPEVHVLQGKVEMCRAGLQPELVLTAGQGARMVDAGKPVSILAQPGEFPNPESLLAKTHEQARQRYEGWLKASEKFAQDEALVLYYDFQRAASDQGILFNRAPQARNGSEGILVGGEWAEGRWPGKKAVRFSRVGDLIRSRPGEHLPTVSLLAWLRLDNPSPASPVALMLSPHVVPGQFYWLVWPRSVAQGGRTPAIHFVKTNSAKQDDHYEETATFHRPVAGRWIQIGVVHDAQSGRISLYSDGKSVLVKSLKDTNPIDLSELVFGNWGYSQEPRNFVGVVDELAILRRALREEEMAALYESGRP
jgi:hypothetical protein